MESIMNSYFIRTHDGGKRMETYSRLSKDDKIKFLQRVMKRQHGINVCTECPDENEEGEVSLCTLCGDLLDFDYETLNKEIEGLK